MSTFAPIALMLRHELRLNWRAASARLSPKLLIGCLVTLLVMMHLIALPIALALRYVPEIPRLDLLIPRVDLLAAVTGAGLALLLTMVSVALIGTVKLIYARGDMDLLLSSPVPPHAIIVVRILTISLGLFALPGFFVLPFANAMAVAGYPRFLAAYVVLLCLALASTAIGVLLAQGLFRLLGARHTRLFAQILAGLIGLAFLFGINLRNILSDSAKDAAVQNLTNVVAHVPAADSWVWLPARAALGEPLPFLIAAILCVGLFVLTTSGLANRLIANAIAASGTAAVKTRGSRRALTAHGGPAAVMRRKEWVLIARDPWLMWQIAQQILLMLPSVFILWKVSSQSPLAWLAVVFSAGQLAGALAWLTVATEEAPDLLATAPVRRVDLLWAKLQAALVPTAAIAAVPVAIAWYMNAWLGFTLLLCTAGSALSCSLLHLRYPSTAKRSELAWRGNSNKIVTFVEMLVALAWVVVGLLMLLFGWWGMLPLVILIPAAVRWAR